MTTFGVAIATAAFQVTIVAILAMIVIAWAGRRSPRTGVNLAAGALLACTLLSAVAVAPLPKSWALEVSADVVVERSADTSDAAASASTRDSGGWRLPFGRLAALLTTPAPSPSDPETRWDAWTIIGCLFIAGVAVEVTRLLAGLWAVASIRRRSVEIGDADLSAKINKLRNEFGVTMEVGVRQSAAVGTAATIGWRRPVILLAPDWATWDQTERRAVLAHELAHVRRRDYLTSVLATVCRAAHFYHPLVRWLAARLRLHQELAADALAAAAAGGREIYLRALARMALRQDAAVVAGMARPFLSDRTSLIRRIAMLRVTEDGRPLNWATRWGLVAMLGLAAFGASALRGPVQAQVPVGGAAVPADDVPPFDLSQVPATSNYLFAIRPAAVLGRPGMKTFADRINRQLAAAYREAGFPVGLVVPVDEIEQIVVANEARKGSPPPGRDWKPNEPRQFMLMNSVLIRMNHDFDWPTVIRSGAAAFKADAREVRPGLFRVAGTNVVLFFRIVDSRTICLLDLESPHNDETVEPLLARMKPDKDPAVAWGPAWPKAQRAASVIAVDNRKGFWTDISGPGKPSPQLNAAIGQPTHAVVCLDLADNLTAHLYVTAAEPSTEQQRANLNQLANIALASLQAEPAETEGQRTAKRIVRELLEGRSITRVGMTDVAEFRSPAKLAEFLSVIEFPHAVKE